MNSLRNLIECIRERPAMYLGSESVIALKIFIDGWYLRDVERAQDIEFFNGFSDWINNKFQNKGTQGWAKLILFHSYDEPTSLKNFFDLYDEYSSEYDSTRNGTS